MLEHRERQVIPQTCSQLHCGIASLRKADIAWWSSKNWWRWNSTFDFGWSCLPYSFSNYKTIRYYPHKKALYNYRLRWARMVTEGALGKLKSRFRALLTTCESRKETMKAIGLSCVTLHKIFNERGDVVPQNIDPAWFSYQQKQRSTGDKWRTKPNKFTSKKLSSWKKK